MENPSKKIICGKYMKSVTVIFLLGIVDPENSSQMEQTLS
jgi:hypothetical protein